MDHAVSSAVKYYIWTYYFKNMQYITLLWARIYQYKDSPFTKINVAYVTTRLKLSLYRRILQNISITFRHITLEIVLHNRISRAHDDVIKLKHFPSYWLIVRRIHRLPVNSPHKGQWRGALMFSLSCAWINSWVDNSEAGDLRRQRAIYDVNVMANEERLVKIMHVN